MKTLVNAIDKISRFWFLEKWIFPSGFLIFMGYLALVRPFFIFSSWKYADLTDIIIFSSLAIFTLFMCQWENYRRKNRGEEK